MKKLSILIAIISFFLVTGQASAYHPERSTSAKLLTANTVSESDNRAKILKAYLERYNSPMADSSEAFVQAADKYGLDWRLLPSIAGLESGYGKHIPFNSYNGWGWGVYGDNVLRFTSWDEAIWTISQALRERYLKNVEYSDPYLIGPTYAASPTWAVRVSGFMQQIRNFEVLNAKDSLSISI